MKTNGTTYEILIKGSGATVLVAIVLALHIQFAYSQTATREQLQQNISQLENEIEFTNKLLAETKETKQASLSRLLILNNKILRREQLIATISSEIRNIDRNIQRTNDTINRLKREYNKLKEEYSRMIYAAFKNTNVYHRLMFIFASEDLTQAYKRIRYLQQYSQYRQSQASVIIKLRAELSQRNSNLEKQRTEKIRLRSRHELERIKLSGEKNTQDRTVRDLQQRESELMRTLRENERAVRRLQKAIEEIIAEEMRRAAEEARKAGKPVPSTFALTPEEIIISNNFALNRGRLPWPTERGVIANSFGEHPHPVLKGIIVKNNGIDILTGKGERARSVFEGTVSKVLSIPGLNNVIIIKHGEYLTVYSNLDQVFVKRGDKVEARQEIGLLHTDKNNKTKLHFEIWKGKYLQNPAHWIARGFQLAD